MATEHQFETNIPQLIQRLGVNLYNDRFVCIRELIQNASDACLIAEGALGAGRGRIDVLVEPSQATITIIDNGIGMTADDLHNYLSTIAASRKSAIRRDLTDKFEGSSGIAGRFGIGFLAVFIVSDDVEVTTRHYTEMKNGHIWQSRGDGKYTIADSNVMLPKGTTIKVKIRNDAMELLDSIKLINILKQHCPFIRTPIYVNRSALAVNHDLPPWHEEADDSAGPSYVSATFHTDPIIKLPIRFDGPWTVDAGEEMLPRKQQACRGATVPRVRLNGYFCIPNSNVNYKPDRCRVYTSGLYVGSLRDGLPDWANFIVGGVECPDLDLTLGRDNVMDNAIWHSAQEIMEVEVTKAIVSSLKDNRAPVRRLWRQIFEVHRHELIEAATNEKKGRYGRRRHKSETSFFDAVRDLMPFKIKGEWLTLDEMIQRKLSLEYEGKQTLFYHSEGSRRHESKGIQERFLFEEIGLSFIDARNYYERDFITEIADARNDIELVPAQEAVSRIIKRTGEKEDERIIREIFESIGVKAELFQFLPSTLSAVIAVKPDDETPIERLDPSDPDAMDRVLQLLSKGSHKVRSRPYHLMVNADNPLIARILLRVKERGGDALVTQVLRQIYFSAVLVFGDTNVDFIAEIVPNISSVMTSFFGHLDEAERELQRVRRIAEDERINFQKQLERVAILMPPDMDGNAVFVAYSYDAASKRVAGDFKNVLAQRGIRPVDGQVDKAGSLSTQIVAKLRACGGFVGILTPRPKAAGNSSSVSIWIAEEKGAAVALGKPVIIIAHKAIDRDGFGKLEGDSVWIESDGTAEGWNNAFDKAAEIIKNTVTK